MSARRLLAVGYLMLAAVHGRDAVEEALTPPDPQAERAQRRAHLQALGVEVA